MNGNAPKEARDINTPDEVAVNMEAAAPSFDPKVGVDFLPATGPGTPMNRLVVIGDSLTHGFQSGAIYNTRLSWPMIVAWEMGIDDGFRFPTYDGYGGLPINIEYLIRDLEHKYGDKIDWWELPLAAFEVRHVMAKIEDYWERGPGSQPLKTAGIMHNLAVYGWDLRDALAWTPRSLAASIKKPKDDIFSQIVENANERAALRVYAPLDPDATVLDGAAELGNQGAISDTGGDETTEGIETLVVFLGANNALGSVTNLQVKWSGPGFDKLDKKDAYNVWRPSHFKAELDELVSRIKKIKARHVILATVPHVTIPPVTRGLGSKVRPGSRYFPYYTRPWIDEQKFNPKDDPNITENQARAIDSAIDQYNGHITDAVRSARQEGRDWYLLEVAGVLDRLASRRYILDPQARPAWWTPYELPPLLDALNPKPDSRLFASGPGGRTQGGLFALDGIHPTTVGYGIVAQEVINILHLAGVTFHLGDRTTPRPGPVQVDFNRLLKLDSLMWSPPRSLSSDMSLIGWLDQTADVFGKLNPF